MGTNCTRSIVTAALALLLTAACSGRSPFAPEGQGTPAGGSAGTSAAGAYELTFTASPDCNRDWWGPDFVPSRTYQTRFNGTSGLLALTGATFAPTWYGSPGLLNGISLSIDRDVVTLYMEDPPVGETNVPGLGYLELYGHATGKLTNPLTKLAFVGDFADCDVPGHTLTLRRIVP